MLSGEGNGKTFYEKVMFSCGGRLINSFAMLYPTDSARPLIQSWSTSRARSALAVTASTQVCHPLRSIVRGRAIAPKAPPVNALQWLTVSPGPADTMSSSFFGGRRRPTIAKWCGATPRRDNRRLELQRSLSVQPYFRRRSRGAFLQRMSCSAHTRCSAAGTSK